MAFWIVYGKNLRHNGNCKVLIDNKGNFGKFNIPYIVYLYITIKIEGFLIREKALQGHEIIISATRFVISHLTHICCEVL